jgi:hypothetical protein
MPQSTTPEPDPQVSSLDLTLVLRARIREAIEAVIQQVTTQPHPHRACGC